MAKKAKDDDTENGNGAPAAGGSGGTGGPISGLPADAYETAQEKAARDHPGDDKSKVPYETGNPLTPEEEVQRAAGIPLKRHEPKKEKAK